MQEKEYTSRDGDRAGDVIYDRLRVANDALVHLRKCELARDRYDQLAHWARAVSCAVSSLDNLPPIERTRAPEIGTWEVLRHQLSHVLNVEFKESARTSLIGTESRIDVQSERRVYARPKGGKGKRVYVDPLAVYSPPTESQLKDLRSAINSIVQYLRDWSERIPDPNRQFFMELAFAHLVGPESTGDSTPLYWVCKDEKARDRVFSIDAASVRLPNESEVRRDESRKTITALAIGKDLRFITMRQARQMSNQQCVADLLIVDNEGRDVEDIKQRFQTVNNDPKREFLILQLQIREY